MKKLTILCSLVFLVVFATACKNEKSLQSYLVEANDKAGFSSIDVPVSSVLSPKADVSDDVKETIKSIKKINVVFLQKTQENETVYETEKATLKNIFKDNKEYKTLSSMKMKGMNMNIYYAGDTDSIDEIVAFGYSQEIGVGVARLLGDNMNPAKIMEVISDMEMDPSNLQSFSAIFKGK